MRFISPAMSGCLGLCFAWFSASAQADILVGNFGADSPSGSVRRYRESDGAFLTNAGSSMAETSAGMALGPDGKLYITGNSLGFGSIARSDPTNGASLGFLVAADIPTGPFQSPSGIAFGVDGTAYSTSAQQMPGGATGVLKFNGAAGAYGGVAIAPGNNGLGTPRNVYTMPGGDLLVTDNVRINRYDKDTLAFVSTFIAPGAGGISVIDQTTFGPDGNFYASDYSNDRVLRYNGSTGAFMDVFVSSVADPLGMTFGNDGKFYVVSAFSTVQRFNGTTGAFIDTYLPTNPNGLRYFLLTAPDLPEPTSAMTLAVVSLTSLVRRRRRG